MEIFQCQQPLCLFQRHRKKLQAKNCARVSIKLGKTTRSKRQLINFLKKPVVKRHKVFFPSSPLIFGAILTQHKHNIVELTLHWEELLLISIDSGLDLTEEKIHWTSWLNCDSQLNSPHCYTACSLQQLLFAKTFWKWLPVFDYLMINKLINKMLPKPPRIARFAVVIIYPVSLNLDIFCKTICWNYWSESFLLPHSLLSNYIPNVSCILS